MRTGGLPLVEGALPVVRVSQAEVVSGMQIPESRPSLKPSADSAGQYQDGDAKPKVRVSR